MSFYEIISQIIKAEIAYLKADWWILLLAIITAAAIKVYVGQEKISEWMKSKSSISIPGSVGFASFTPLCACGTMAVMLSMFVTALPWGPVMAFLVSSPLSSPSQFIFQSGILGFDIALAVLISSIVMGLTVGFLATFLEMKTDFFRDQYRLKNDQACTSCSKVNSVNKDAISEQCCNSDLVNTDNRLNNSYNNSKSNIIKRFRIKEVLKEVYELGIKRILIYFMLFIALGQLIEMMIPTEWILALFSSNKYYSVPLAALIGLPLYVSGSSALPMLRSFMEIGAGHGPILAFLIAGQATSVAVIAGISTFIKKKAIIFYIGFIMSGAILSGYIYQIFKSF